MLPTTQRFLNTFQFQNQNSFEEREHYFTISEGKLILRNTIYPTLLNIVLTVVTFGKQIPDFRFSIEPFLKQ